MNVLVLLLVLINISFSSSYQSTMFGLKLNAKSSSSKLFSSKSITPSTTLPLSAPLKIAFQGEPGAYSEKAARTLLGARITTLPCQSFEETFKSVASGDADYCLVPIENSLGGSIHANFDLLLRYDLHIIAEHELRVEHSLLALPGVKKSDIKRVFSHPQALAQCDTYLRNLGVTKEEFYDTAGSAKMIKEKNLLDAAAIASDLAGSIHGLDVLESNIEDYDINFTRFLLLSRIPVNSLIPAGMAAKTSIVFVLPNNPGALYKALACFSLRDIDFSKIESRPTSVKLLQTLQLKRTSTNFPDKKSEVNAQQDLPRFRYTFYLDFLAPELDDRTQNALHHLREQSDFVRILGSYPAKSQLIGPVRSAIDSLEKMPVTREFPSNPIIDKNKKEPLKIGIIGFGKFGQFLGKTFAKNNHVYCVDKDDMSAVAKELGCTYYPLYDLNSFSKLDLDVIVLSVSIISFEDVLRMLPKDMLKGKLIADVLSVKVHAKETMLDMLPSDCDIVCTHPMFGPESGKFGWGGLPFLYDRIRIKNVDRCERFLSLWESERCKMIEMSCEEHDQYAANSQFITHLTGRILWQQNLVPTPIDTKGFQTVLNLVENTCKDSFDLFFGLYFYNTYAGVQLAKIREALAQVERQLAAKEAYLSAKAEVNNEQRSRILEECRVLLLEASKEAREASNNNDST
jgi:exosome complex component RRP43